MSDHPPLSPSAQRAASLLLARGFLRANSSHDTLVGLAELRDAGLARWDEDRRQWVVARGRDPA